MSYYYFLSILHKCSFWIFVRNNPDLLLTGMFGVTINKNEREMAYDIFR
ncbi:hypothetical protein HMPREF0240_03044 [Clostridium sp. D5]|nr:hypothetical protein HMPREF0240_03044 [Clostridium sp. D5]